MSVRPSVPLQDVINKYCAALIASRRDSGSYRTSRDLLSRVVALQGDDGTLVHLHDDALLRDIIVSGGVVRHPRGVCRRR